MFPQKITKGQKLIVISDGESDDVMAAAFLIASGVTLYSVIVLNEKCEKDGWDRYEKLCDLFKLMFPNVEDRPMVNSFADLSVASAFLLANLTWYDPCPTILSLGNLLPVLELARSPAMQQPADPSGRKAPIPVLIYGSVNFRWAAKELAKRGEDKPYNVIADILNSPTNVLQFNVFETFGAFGSTNTIDAHSTPELYDWLANDPSPLAAYLRQCALGWNKLKFDQLVTSFKLNDQIDWPLVVSGKGEAILPVLEAIALATPDVSLDVKILTAIIKYPCEVVCADIGLVVAAMHSSDAFIPSKIEFAKTGRPFTQATPLSLDETKLYSPCYYVGGKDDLASVTNHVLNTFTSFGAEEYISPRTIAANALIAAFSDCLVKGEFTRYPTAIPHGEHDTEVQAEYLCWSDGERTLALYVTDDDTQIVCRDLPPGTFVPHTEVGFVAKLKAYLSEPQLVGYFPATLNQ